MDTYLFTEVSVLDKGTKYLWVLVYHFIVVYIYLRQWPLYYSILALTQNTGAPPFKVVVVSVTIQHC